MVMYVNIEGNKVKSDHKSPMNLKYRCKKIDNSHATAHLRCGRLNVNLNGLKNI